MNAPVIDITVNAGEWPEAAELEPLVRRAIEATADTGKLRWTDDAELSLLFTDDSEIAAINGEWRSKQKPTNVLSFPGADITPDEVAGPMIGDLVFAYETVAREAKKQQKGFKEHFTHLVVHGFLHLFGYVHEEDAEAEEMERLEQQILARLGITDPYAYL